MPDGASLREEAHAAYQDVDSSSLANMPVQSNVLPQLVASWWPLLYNHVERRRRALITWRWSWLLHWQVLAEFFMPRRWQWLTIVANRMWRGRPVNEAIIDSTGLQAVRVCASGLWTGLMSPSRKWFGVGIVGMETDDIPADGKTWLERVYDVIDTVMHQSNFFVQMAQMFQDETVFGTSPPIIYEDKEDVIRVYLPCPGEYTLGSGSRLNTNTLHRDYTFTILQTVEWFGYEKCTQSIQKMFDDGTMDTEVVICHIIEPNYPLMGPKGQKTDRYPVSRLFPFREVYWVKGDMGSQPLSIRGFHEQPFVVARGGLVGNDPYGRSFCMDALGDAKQVQLESLRKAEFIEKGVRPPMGADPELKNEPASIMPARITYMNTAGGKKGFWALFEPNPVWLQGITADIAAVNLRTEKCLFVDVFLAISRMEGVQPKNELELTKRDLERLQQLGPLVELHETEVATPAINRIFAICQRRGMIPDMPASLQGRTFKIEYQSIMRLAMQASDAVSLKDFLAAMGAASSAAKAATLPDPLRTVNLDQWAKDYAKATHMRTHILFTDDQVQQHDQARAQATQQAHTAATAPGNAMAAVQAAKTLSETSLNNGSALDAIAGSGAFPKGR
jgi:hypothetical protein